MFVFHNFIMCSSNRFIHSNVLIYWVKISHTNVIHDTEKSCELELRKWWGVLDTTLVDTVCQSPGTAVSSTNKTDRHDIVEILLKVALSTISQADSKKNSHIRGFVNHICRKENVTRHWSEFYFSSSKFRP